MIGISKKKNISNNAQLSGETLSNAIEHDNQSALVETDDLIGTTLNDTTENQTGINNATSRVQIRKKREKTQEEIKRDDIEKKKAFIFLESDKKAQPSSSNSFGNSSEKISFHSEGDNLDSIGISKPDKIFKLDDNNNLIEVSVIDDENSVLPGEDAADENYAEDVAEYESENDTLSRESAIITQDTKQKELTVSEQSSIRKSDSEAYLDSILPGNVDYSSIDRPVMSNTEFVQNSIRSKEKLPPNHKVRITRDILTALTKAQQGFITRKSKIKNAQIVFENSECEKLTKRLPNGELSLSNSRVYDESGLPKPWNSIFEVPLLCNEVVDLDLGVCFELPDGYGVRFYMQPEVMEKFGLELEGINLLDSNTVGLPIVMRLRAFKNTSYIAKYQNLFIAKIVKLS